MAAGVTAQLEAALSRVIRLADEHVRTLDSPMRCMAACAWVGGGAPAFSKALAGRRAGMQRAFQQAAEQIAARIRQMGGQAPPVPSFSTSVSVMSATPRGFSGMDVATMERIVADLQRAGRELPEAGRRLSDELSALCVPAASAKQVADAGEWAQGQVGDLRRRLSVIQREHIAGMETKAMAGFGLFGAFAPDPDGVSRLTAAAGNGDATALKALVALQSTGKDATLANRLSAWWRQLDPTAQQRLISRSPRLIGGLNGLPAPARDQANRKYLITEKAWLGSELARLRALPSTKEADEAITDMESKSRQLAAVELSLALGGRPGHPPAYLLQVEFGGFGKTAISYGNPDEADNIVAYVPGTGAMLTELKVDAERAAFLWDQANFFDPGKKVASIVWLGYEAPQFDMPLSLRHTVINTNAAETGAPALASFTDGLHAAHQAGSGVRLTVLGHSYGSTVAGLAARERFSSFADQMILVGSPGVGALAAKDLGVPSVWVGEAPNDPVGDIGSLPLVLTGTLDDDTFLPKWTGPLGADPSDREFGAREFYVPDTGDPALTFGAHTKYWGRSEGVWDAQSVSLRNIARLVNGQSNKLIPFPGKP